MRGREGYTERPAESLINRLTDRHTQKKMPFADTERRSTKKKKKRREREEYRKPIDGM